MADSKLSEGIGCLVFSVIVLLLVWVVWSQGWDFLADNFGYVTSSCALEHLQKPNCNTEQDVIAVDEVRDASYNDSKGNRVEARSVIYEFKKRPINGPVTADVLRDTQLMFKNDQGHWKAVCEQ